MNSNGKNHRIDHHLSQLEQIENKQRRSGLIVIASIFVLLIIGTMLFFKGDPETNQAASNPIDTLNEPQVVPVKQNINQPVDKSSKKGKTNDTIQKSSTKREQQEVKEDPIKETKPQPDIPNRPAPEAPETSTINITRSASFPGGPSKMEQFLKDNVVYPTLALEHDINGKVDVQIRIDEKGNISRKQIIKGLGYGCDEEVLRAIATMPKWNPALKQGKPVSKSYVITVTFDLPKN